MKIQSIHLLVCIILVYILACGSPDHIWNEDSNRVAREVRKTLTNYYSDVNKEGFMAEFKYLDTSSMFSWHPPGYASPISFDSVKSALLRNAILYPQVQVTWDSLVIEPVSIEKSKYAGKITSVLRDTAGNLTTYHFYEEGLLMKKEDGWKLVSGKTVMVETD